MITDSTTRRALLAACGVAASVTAARAPGAEAAAEAKPAPAPRAARMPLGLPTYMFKNYTLDQTIAMARRIAVQHICLRSNLLPLTATDDQIAAAIAKVEAAGLFIYGGGVIYMRTAAQVNRAFAYSRAAGFKLISISIAPALLGLLERKVKQSGLRAAIHNHGPEDRHWPTPQAIYAKVSRLDKRIGICHDTGHTARAGVDPVEATRKTADRIFDVHLKDVDAATGKGRSTELGRGVVDVAGILRVLRQINYRDVIGIEYEKHMKDLLPGLAESTGYARGALAAMG